jgi:hypothetical protein
MGVGQRFRDVLEHADDLGDRQRSSRQTCAQRLAFHERHRVEGETARVAGGEHGDDVGLLQRGDCPNLALEPLGTQPFGEFRREHFHDNLPLEPQLFGDEHPTHAAAAQLALEAIGIAERELQLRHQTLGHSVGGVWLEAKAYVSGGRRRPREKLDLGAGIVQ